jgi:3-hydroxyisobutyrate dehydrogenase-like beta-hydroxyacid dehydrogenase
MTAPMAANLERAGYRVTVFDIDAARARQAARAIALLDAPVSGDVPRATNGTLTIRRSWCRPP